MSLISVMYHHINSDKYSNHLDMFDQHLAYISQHFTTVFPHDSLPERPICLTFDDAYADFYFFVYPLLKKYKLKAIIAVPTRFILPDTDISPEKRMGFKHDETSMNYPLATHTTFKELREMIDSGLVQVASHSHSHVNLTEAGIDVDRELRYSKEILEANLPIRVDSFVFPYGKYNARILQEAKKYYPYVFRIGNAVQKDFKGIKGVIYRVNGDGLQTPDDIFKPQNMLRYRLKALTKRLMQT